jgi:hypothetical protein
VASPLDGVGFADDGCHDDCCAPLGNDEGRPSGRPSRVSRPA